MYEESLTLPDLGRIEDLLNRKIKEIFGTSGLISLLALMADNNRQNTWLPEFFVDNCRTIMPIFFLKRAFENSPVEKEEQRYDLKEKKSAGDISEVIAGILKEIGEALEETFIAYAATFPSNSESSEKPFYELTWSRKEHWLAISLTYQKITSGT
jgi:hypothetical protein